jgi:hypothetical protein
MRREVAEGERPPWGYGAAYRLFTRPAWIAYPVPLNLFVRWTRNLYFNVAMPAKRANIEQRAYDSGYDAGYKVGISVGKDLGKSDAIEFLQKLFKEIMK